MPKAVSIFGRNIATLDGSSAKLLQGPTFPEQLAIPMIASFGGAGILPTTSRF